MGINCDLLIVLLLEIINKDYIVQLVDYLKRNRLFYFLGLLFAIVSYVQQLV